MTTTDTTSTDPAAVVEFTADELAAEMAQASMRPYGLDQHQDVELSDALSTVEQYGRVDASGRWAAYIQITADFLAEKLHRAQPNIGRNQCRRLVQTAWKNTATDPAYRIRRVSIDLDHRTPAPDAPQLVFVALPEGTSLAQQGYEAAALLYFPDTYPDRTTGEIRSGWYSIPGHVGIVKLYRLVDQADEAALSLAQAVRYVATLNDPKDDATALEEEEAPKPASRTMPVW